MPSDPPDALVRLCGAQLGHRGRVVLRDVDLVVRGGEFWCVLGPNGSGKTTLLHSVLGLLPLLGGAIRRDPSRASLLHTGFVPQKSAINAALPTTVREFVSLGAIGSARPREDRASDLAWALERVELAGMQERSYWSLSGGQRQRALVARALVRRPSLLVLDEATEGMDAGSEERFLATLDALHRDRETTLLFVTHNHHIAERHATHVALAWGGALHAGPRETVVASAEMREAYGMLRAHAGSAHAAAEAARRGGGAPA